jgi:hypothetical protein
MFAVACASPGDATNDGETGEAEAAVPTWHQDVAPLVAERCTGCHLEGGIAPFSLTDYEEAAQFADQIVVETENRTMPPFLARRTDECTPEHEWKDDPSLSDEELEMLRRWAEGGAPEGDPDTAAELPEPPSLELTTSHDRYTIPAGITIDGDRDKHVCFVVDPELTDGILGYRFLKGIQVNPGNDAIVHHVLVYTGTNQPDTGEDGYYDCFGAPSGDLSGLIAAWAPGALPQIVPEGMGMAISEGSQLIVNVHYHPTGGGPEVDDSTSIDIEWLQDDQGNTMLPENVATLYLDGNGRGLMTPPFEIPAGASNHVEEQLIPVSSIMNSVGTSDPIKVWSAGTHMHYVGTDMMIGVQRFDPQPGQSETECLVHTPQWDFNWQRGYEYDVSFDEYPELTSSDYVYMRCRYDNSIGNKFVAEALIEQGLDEPVDVQLGDDTLDEMCLGVFGVSIPTSSLFP